MKSTSTIENKAAVRLLFSALVLSLVTVFPAQSATIVLSPVQSGNYWYTRNQWSNGSDTNDGFTYGAADTGLVHAQKLYYYYGGADRYFETKDIYLQIPLSSLTAATIESVSLNFYVASKNTLAETFLKHLDTQTTIPTGDAGQKLAGTGNIVSSNSMSIGWNQIDVTASIISDLNNSYAYSVFSIPSFAQGYDENRLLSIYGASAADVEGVSVKPYLSVAIPEPSTCGFILGGLIVCTGLCSRRRAPDM